MSDLSKAVDLVRQARMDSWQRMAKELPDHHVLAVEMFRVDRNTTVSIFTLVRNGRVVQEVLQGDGRGLGVKPVVPRVEQLAPINLGRQFHIDALLVPPPPAAVAVAAAAAAMSNSAAAERRRDRAAVRVENPAAAHRRKRTPTTSTTTSLSRRFDASGESTCGASCVASCRHCRVDRADDRACVRCRSRSISRGFARRSDARSQDRL